MLIFLIALLLTGLFLAAIIAHWSTWLMILFAVTAYAAWCVLMMIFFGITKLPR